MMGSNKKKSEQLGMSHGSAANRLRKEILWRYVVQNKDNICFQCHDIIRGINDLSIEHKVPWLDSDDPIGLYFHPDNIAFSHLRCNIGAARQVRERKLVPKHGTYARYRHGREPCRCEDCTKANTEYQSGWDRKAGRTNHLGPIV